MQNKGTLPSILAGTIAAAAVLGIVGTGLASTALDHAQSLFVVALPDQNPAFVLPDGLPVDLDGRRGTIHTAAVHDCLPPGPGYIAMTTDFADNGKCQVIRVRHLQEDVSVRLQDGSHRTWKITLDEERGLSLRKIDRTLDHETQKH